MAKTIELLTDLTSNDSDKTFTVPNNTIYEVILAHVVYTSTATAGNRQLLFAILDENSDLILDIHAGATQAASNTHHYSFLKGIFREASFIDDAIQVPLPTGLILKPGWKIRIYDGDAVDAAADDMTVKIVVTDQDNSGKGFDI